MVQSADLLPSSHFYGQLSSLPPSAGESCPKNGQSSGSVSTQHSSPRSDFTYGNSSTQAPGTNMGNATAISDGTSTASAQPSDVSISRKESEGFGFVIISSLNRPETATTNSESSHCCGSGVKEVLVCSQSEQLLQVMNPGRSM